MTWTEVADRLAEARTYWLGSTTASGGPARGAGLGRGDRPDALLVQRAEHQQYLPDHDPDFDVVWAIRPLSAMAWQLDDYDASQRRWSPLW